MKLTDIWPTLGQGNDSGVIKNPHPTKRGPGRKHGQRVKHGTKPTPPTGNWLGQHTNPKANARRALKCEIGARQYRKQRKALAAAARGQQ